MGMSGFHIAGGLSFCLTALATWPRFSQLRLLAVFQWLHSASVEDAFQWLHSPKAKEELDRLCDEARNPSSRHGPEAA